MVDRDTLAELIEAGRLRQAPSAEIADAILAKVEDPNWAKAMSHPTRSAILHALRDHGPLSPVRAVELFPDITLGTLAYHFRTLSEFGLIELTDTVPRRGAMEHIYTVVSDSRSD